MIQASGIVQIDASPEDVFALISDVHQCGELNPWIKVINITPEPPGLMHKGTKYHYRVVIKGRMTEYTSEVLAYEPLRYIEIQTHTTPALSIKYRIEATDQGVKLEQTVTSELPREQPEVIQVPGWFSKLAGKWLKGGATTEQNADLRQEEAQIQQQLQEQLDEWLIIVKTYVEAQRGTFRA